MPEFNIPSLRPIRRHVYLVLFAIILAGAVFERGWHFLSERQSQLNYRETRLDDREKELRKREDAERDASLSTAKQQAVLEDQRKQLETVHAALEKWQNDLTSQNQRVGLDAQEADLRKDANRFVAEYTALMSKPEIYQDPCARQRARRAGAPLLDRIDSIGHQLRNGDDLLTFVERQGSGVWSSDCERPSAQNASNP